MRKLKIGLAAAGTLAMLALACVDDNPFTADPDTQWQGGATHPHIDLWGTSSEGLGSTVLNDLDPATEGVQDAILVVFDQVMDPATMVEASLELAATTSGAPAPEIEEVAYYPTARRMEVHATFARETAYLLTLTAGAPTNLAGEPLDPNFNAQADGSPWDDARLTFHNGTAEEMDLMPPIVDIFSPPEQGGVPDPGTSIRIVFERGPMDASTFGEDALRLLLTEDSSEVGMRIDSVTPSQILATPTDSLDYGARYTVVLSSQVADSAGNLLDSNGDGHVWPDEPDFVWDFQLVDDSTTHGTPPTVAGVSSEVPLSFKVQFEESLTGDQVSMDASTLVPANIQCVDAGGQIPLEVGTLSPSGDAVTCYMLREPQGEVTVIVSLEVLDSYGNPLDGNGNGLGGEPGLDDWTGTL
jgi:hypothetical protein